MNSTATPAQPGGQRPPLTSRIAERLQLFLDSGRLRPGDRLPPERSLAADLGVSRSSLREALKALAARGLLQSRPGSGAFLAPDCRQRLAETFLEDFPRTRRSLAEVLAVRLILEPPMAEMAARQAQAPDLAQLRMLLLCQRRDIVAGGTGLEADSAFHACLARIAGNALLLDLVEGVAGRLAETRAAFLQEEESHRMAALVAHETILAAVERGDGPGAARAMREHLARMEPRFLASGRAGEATTPARLAINLPK